MEDVTERKGDNLYPVSLDAKFGNLELSLDVPAGVWNPTPHGVQLGNVLAEQDFSGERILELGTGCGIHAIVLAKRGASGLLLTEIEQPILDNARYNLEKHGVETPTEYVVADWVQVESGGFDALVTNPPFGKSGKRYRRYFIDTLILEAHKLVRPGGRLIFIQSSMANVPRSIRLMEENGMSVRILGETDGPFRKYYFDDPVYW
ncbi:MAG: methyltransferase [Planctomycetota bacterium]